jgi:hypothetical protein
MFTSNVLCKPELVPRTTLTHFLISLEEHNQFSRCKCKLQMTYMSKYSGMSTQVHVHSFVFSVLYCKSLFVPCLLAVVLSVLQFTDFEDPFGIFKLISQ